MVATSFPDDLDFEFGILVTPDRRVFQYGYSYRGQAEDGGRLTEWRDETDRWQSRPNAADVAAAMAVLDSRSGKQ